MISSDVRVVHLWWPAKKHLLDPGSYFATGPPPSSVNVDLIQSDYQELVWVRLGKIVKLIPKIKHYYNPAMSFVTAAENNSKT